MNTLFRPALALVLLLTLLLGVAAPLAMTGVAQVVFPTQAGGSLIERNGQVIGSALIGQNFAEPRYFHPRPSATTEPDPENEGSTRAAPYNAASSAASQQGPTSAALLEAIRTRVAEAGPAPVPADAVTASGSGLDPHISPENAARQVTRVATARGIPEERVRALLAQYTEGRELGLLGEPHVNVLRLNLALDDLR
ncbi:potassium-transporting ATPase subunit KdpC [Plastoroseomonas hellenica]|uniref:potassium-transporting ATPase subunit KdpC n=1 Tax=Plastoroseomonas hellenica TaxID=2687306 RepID=UPI001BA8E9B4|nr:potassium-transporting ATPase subunit KdpC [Plastoroseomonas hellenica]MBR0644041.1 potassium-transporting ATPase subunit KdpC [Plastoroseomonas hellenica]